ncbi:MAG: gluconokinase, GntK/IdnK-type [Vicinamibacterales bacterium]
MVIVIGGVAGSGKTTVGRAVAARLGWEFHDADDLHDAANVERMRTGGALDDDDRYPWLLRVRRVIEDAIARRTGAIVACSALKARYRLVLGEALDEVEFVFLHADRDILRSRLQQRTGHFAGAALVDSQLEALELPLEGFAFDASLGVDDLVDLIVSTLPLQP